MKSPLLIVLGISSTLLGLYILIISLLNTNEQTHLHIGCYLTDHYQHNSLTFRARLQQLNSTGQLSRSFHKVIRESELTDPQIHKKSVQLTKNVETYIKNLELVKKYQQNNIEFFSQLLEARQSYEICANEIKEGIDIQQGKQLWRQYNNCSSQISQIKDKLDYFNSQRNSYLAEIEKLVKYEKPNNPNSQFDLEAQLKKVKQQYERESSLNDKNKENSKLNLKRLQSNAQTLTNDYNDYQQKLAETEEKFKACSKKITQFQKCQNITKTLDQYGRAETLQNLEQKIKGKRLMLVKLRQLVVQARESGADSKAITEMYQKREKQFVQTIRLMVSMRTYQQVDCYCSENQRKQFQQQYNTIKAKINSSKKQLNQLKSQIQSEEEKIKEADRRREKLLNNFREETDKIKNKKKFIAVSLQESLNILKIKLAEVNSNITDFRYKFSSVYFVCNQYKDRLALKLKDSETVVECFKKKDLYEKLKSKAQLILKKDEASSQAKQNLIKVLNSFIYPNRIEHPLVQIKEIIEPNQKDQKFQNQNNDQILDQINSEIKYQKEEELQQSQQIFTGQKDQDLKIDIQSFDDMNVKVVFKDEQKQEQMDQALKQIAIDLILQQQKRNEALKQIAIDLILQQQKRNEARKQIAIDLILQQEQRDNNLNQIAKDQKLPQQEEKQDGDQNRDELIEEESEQEQSQEYVGSGDIIKKEQPEQLSQATEENYDKQTEKEVKQSRQKIGKDSKNIEIELPEL